MTSNAIIPGAAGQVPYFVTPNGVVSSAGALPPWIASVDPRQLSPQVIQAALSSVQQGNGSAYPSLAAVATATNPQASGYVAAPPRSTSSGSLENDLSLMGISPNAISANDVASALSRFGGLSAGTPLTPAMMAVGAAALLMAEGKLKMDEKSSEWQTYLALRQEAINQNPELAKRIENGFLAAYAQSQQAPQQGSTRPSMISGTLIR